MTFQSTPPDTNQQSWICTSFLSAEPCQHLPINITLQSTSSNQHHHPNNICSPLYFPLTSLPILSISCSKHLIFFTHLLSLLNNLTQEMNTQMVLFYPTRFILTAFPVKKIQKYCQKNSHMSNIIIKRLDRYPSVSLITFTNQVLRVQ